MIFHSPPRGSANLAVLHLSFWVTFGVALLVAIAPYPHRWEAPLQKLVLALFGCAVSALIAGHCRRTVERGGPALGVKLRLAATAIAAGTVWTIAFNTLPLLFFGLLGVDVRAIGGPERIFAGNVLHTAVMGAWILGYTNLLHTRQLARVRERVLEAALTERDARLRALRYQLDPHYMFNALNSLSTMVLDGSRQDAQEMIERLARFLRASLSTDAPETTLDEDLAMTQDYVAVERVRFGDGVDVTIDVEDDCGHARVPVLFLQPLMENAIRHAARSETRPASIDLRVRRERDRLHVLLRNTAAVDAADPGHGIGLRNMRERLAVLHDHRAHITTALRHGVFTTSIDIPFTA